MFKDEVARALIQAAKENDLPPSCLLALIEVETSGKPFEEADGHTPAFLYERHVAYKEASKKNLLKRFVSAGLAIPKWNRATQYKDERSSSSRMALMNKAKEIDEEVAFRSASWGLGQQMGFNAEMLGYANAIDMVERMRGSVAAQIDCVIRFLKKRHILKPLADKDFARVALAYNGSGYKQNNYDHKLADAEKRWARKVETMGDRAAPPEQLLTRGAILSIQKKLLELGYAEIGKPDGTWGSRTVGAVSAFQAHEGLKVTGHYDEATAAALKEANARPVSKERETATTDDIESRTIDTADGMSTVGKAKVIIGGATGAGAVLEKGGDILNQASDATEKVEQVSNIWTTIHDTLLSNTTLLVIALLIGTGVFVWFAAEKIKAYRLEDHQKGLHA
jgi:hypothetical protein